MSVGRYFVCVISAALARLILAVGILQKSAGILLRHVPQTQLAAPGKQIQKSALSAVRLSPARNSGQVFIQSAICFLHIPSLLVTFSKKGTPFQYIKNLSSIL
jgi:hypothetical protein